MIRWRIPIAFTVLFAACAGKSPPAATARDVTAPPALTLQAIAEGENGAAERTLAHRDALPGGRRFALVVSADIPSYLYAWHRGPSGGVERLPLASAESASPTPPGTAVRLPGEGLWFKLDEHPGKEVFHVVATRDAQGPDALHALEEQIPVEREPEITNAGNRLPGPSYRAVMDERGVAAITFIVLHQ